MTTDADLIGEKRGVGYKRPPQHGRFKPGQSGNPRGRQKGLRNLATDVKRMLQEPIKVTVGGKERRLSSQEAALKRLREMALKGDARALDRMLALAQWHNGDESSEAAGAPLEEEDQAILDDYVLERARVISAATGADEAAAATMPMPDSKPD
jgi:Family of unknown function (DUF5681)